MRGDTATPERQWWPERVYLARWQQGVLALAALVAFAGVIVGVLGILGVLADWATWVGLAATIGGAVVELAPVLIYWLRGFRSRPRGST